MVRYNILYTSFINKRSKTFVFVESSDRRTSSLRIARLTVSARSLCVRHVQPLRVHGFWRYRRFCYSWLRFRRCWPSFVGCEGGTSKSSSCHYPRAYTIRTSPTKRSTVVSRTTDLPVHILKVGARKSAGIATEIKRTHAHWKRALEAMPH